MVKSLKKFHIKILKDVKLNFSPSVRFVWVASDQNTKFLGIDSYFVGLVCYSSDSYILARKRL